MRLFNLIITLVIFLAMSTVVLAQKEQVPNKELQQICKVYDQFQIVDRGSGNLELVFDKSIIGKYENYYFELLLVEKSKSGIATRTIILPEDLAQQSCTLESKAKSSRLLHVEMKVKSDKYKVPAICRGNLVVNSPESYVKYLQNATGAKK